MSPLLAHVLPRALRASPLLLLAPAWAQVQLVIPQPVIDEHPQAATVLSGQGAAFTVKARAAGGGLITNIVWRDGNGRMLQNGASPTYRRSAWTAADAGDYTATVHHSSGLSVTSRPARLTVLSRGWAPLGGRAVSMQASTRRPGLTHCPTPMLAWVENLPNGTRELRTHRFDGVEWLPMAQGSLLTQSGSSPNESSLQCSTAGPQPMPVLAFSESWQGGGAIQVRRWEGQRWLTTGTPQANPGGMPRAPMLHMAPFDPLRGAAEGLNGGSLLAWREGSTLYGAHWDQQFGWETYGYGPVPGSGFGDPLLALDTVTRVQQGLTYNPLLGAVSIDAAGGQPRVLFRSPTRSWTDLGKVQPPKKGGVGEVGVAFTNENSAPRVVLVWTEGGQSFKLRSASLFDQAYRDLIDSKPGANTAWGPYAEDLDGENLRATAFDPQPFDVSCRGSGPDSFTVALSANGKTSVLMARCPRGGGPPTWVNVVPRLDQDAAFLALKMLGHDAPLLATIAPSGFGGHAVTVWTYRP